MPDLRSLPDAHLPTLASADVVARGDELRALLSPLAGNISRLAGAATPIRMQVLNQADWNETQPEFVNYNLPLIDDDDGPSGGIIFPAQFHETTARGFAPPQGALSAADARRLLDRYGAIGIAHLVLNKSGAKLPARWLAKMAAIYLTLCAERAAHPADLDLWTRWAEAWEDFDPAAAGEEVATEQYSIETFEFLGTAMELPAYFWMQAAMARRAIGLIGAYGEGFAQPLLSLFAGTGELTSHDALGAVPAKLDGLSPGWTTWVASLRGTQPPISEEPHDE